MLEEEETAENEAEEELQAAQQRLDDKLAALRKRTDIDERTKEIMLENLRRVEQNKLDASKASIEQEKEERIERAREEMHRGVRRTEDRVRFWTLVLPPLPALLIGLCVLLVQAFHGWAETPVKREG
jgi:ABC-2 type transport system permease protein